MKSLVVMKGTYKGYHFQVSHWGRKQGDQYEVAIESCDSFYFYSTLQKAIEFALDYLDNVRPHKDESGSTVFLVLWGIGSILAWELIRHLIF